MYLDKSVGVFGLVFQHFLGKLSHDAVELIGTVGRDYAPVKNGNVIYSEFERNQICGLLATYITRPCHGAESHSAFSSRAGLGAG